MSADRSPTDPPTVTDITCWLRCGSSSVWRLQKNQQPPTYHRVFLVRDKVFNLIRFTVNCSPQTDKNHQQHLISCTGVTWDNLRSGWNLMTSSSYDSSHGVNNIRAANCASGRHCVKIVGTFGAVSEAMALRRKWSKPMDTFWTHNTGHSEWIQIYVSHRCVRFCNTHICALYIYLLQYVVKNNICIWNTFCCTCYILTCFAGWSNSAFKDCTPLHAFIQNW